MIQFFARFFIVLGMINLTSTSIFSIEIPKGALVLGDENAPVTLFEYSSLTCPHCAHFHAETLPKAKEKYIDSGILRLVLVPYPLDGWAVKGATLVGTAPLVQQWSVLEALYAAQSDWMQAKDDQDLLERFARITGLELAFIKKSIADPHLMDRVLQGRLAASQAYTITAAPTFVSGMRVWGYAIEMAEINEICEPYAGERKR
ncbi:MAG: thioredoxin domain-containing protein [bacterium]|nr:thioredoxin domain-containing protein [bacterium]